MKNFFDVADKCCICETSLGVMDGVTMEIKGNTKHICDSCWNQMNEYHTKTDEYETSMQSEEVNTIKYKSNVDGEHLKPLDIKNLLDRYVIGQEYAKKVLSVACYNHFKRVKLNDKSIRKSNILLIGPTGSGKTYLVEIIAKILDVPVAITTATTLTEAGYIGDDVESVVRKLLDKAAGDIDKAQKGIIFIDEIDKLVSGNNDARRQVGGKGVQQALLTLLEGTNVSVSRKDNIMGGEGFKVTVDTSNILFICGGAFPDAEKIVLDRISNKRSIGFNSYVDKEVKNDNLLLNITSDDLREFGLIPEFIGRLPIIAPLENITIDILRKILIEPEDSIISQYKKLIEYDGVSLTFNDDALETIAEIAINKKTGARALRSILEDILLDVMFYIPSEPRIEEVCITKKMVLDKIHMQRYDSKRAIQA